MDESKRSFIKHSVGLIAAGGLVAGAAKHAETVEPPEVPASMKAPGAGLGEYGSPAKYEGKVTRTLIRSCRAASGPVCRCACCSRRPASTGARSGFSPRERTPPP